MAYIGNIPADKYQTLQKQSFTTSATDTYTLSYSVTNPQDLALFINNVRQNPNDAYTVSNTTLTLSSAITGSDTMYAVFLGRAVETVAPALSSVTNDMLAGSIANSKLANSSITLNGSAVSLGGSATIGGGKIGQVLQVTHSSDISTTSTSFVDTGISLAITPSATSSKILVMTDVLAYTAGSNQGNHMFTKILRGSTDLAQRRVQSYDQGGNGVEYESNISHMYLDSPSTTSETTYKIQYRMGAGSSARIHHGNGKTGSLTLLEVLA